jgi:trigger factor
MTATNHALTGAAIGLLVGNPLIAIPLAIASHFICDIIPHFGSQDSSVSWIGSKPFKIYLVIDALICFALVVLLYASHPLHWQTAAVSAFAAASPDFFWIPMFLEARKGRSQKLRPVAQPTVSVTKFVPFTELEFTAETTVVGEIKLADYKKIKLPREAVKVEAADVSDVLDNLRGRAATRKEVKREAKKGDEVTIDFTGTDAKTKEPVAGADGKDYPLVLGSDTFIPGFEDELVGAKPGALTTFEITFPKDYGATELQDRKVAFAVTVKKISELVKPKLDDEFAQSVGPFKTLADLKSDIKKQLQLERQQEADRKYDNELVEKIANGSDVAIPASLVEEEIDRLEDEERRNLVYRGQTWEEHLAEEGVTPEEHREKQRPAAELRVKAGLVLSEISEKENVGVTPEELEIRVQLLKGQYTDAAMQSELDKTENRRDIHSRMLTEKTLDLLRSYAK